MPSEKTSKKQLEQEIEKLQLRMNLFQAVSARVLGARDIQSLLQSLADSSRELTGAGVSACGHGYVNGEFQLGAASRTAGYSPCPPRVVFGIARGGAYLDLIHKTESLRLTDAQLRAREDWWGLPGGHAPLRGLLGARLSDRSGQPTGLIMVSDKEGGGDFTAEDESLLRQLAAIASLALQHVAARQEVEKEAERARWLARFPEDNPNPVMRVSADGMILYQNRATAELPGWNCRIGEPVIEPMASAAARALADETGVQIEFSSKERIFLGCAVPFRTKGYVNIYALDITERKKAEEALLRSEERLRDSYREFAAIFERSIVGKGEADPASGRFVRVNQALADLTGYSIEELCRMTFTDITYPEDRQRNLEILEPVCAGKAERWQNEKRYLRKDGSLVWVNVAGNVIHYEDGRPDRLVAVVQDITARRQAEQKLKDLNDSLEKRIRERTLEAEQRALQLRQLAADLTLSEQRERQRLAMILHDGLQQTLVAAKFSLAALERSGDGSGKTAEISGLIDDCIDTSRSLTAELSPPVLYKGGLLPALEWLVKSMRDRHGLTVRLASREPIQRSGEEINILLFQSVRELLFNVVKHAGTKEVRIEVKQLDGHIQVDVTDDGAGFDITQLHSKGGRSGSIGLFSIKERLGYCGGRMEIQSAPGKGSRFRLIAPLVISVGPEILSASQPEVSVAIVSRSEAGETDAGRRIRVVLVDDHVVMRQGLAGLLQTERDIEIVGEASDGESALTLVREMRPDVILMDIGMPGMDGIQATKIIHREMPEISIIGLSMFQEGEQAAAIREAGAVQYLTKTGPSEAVIGAIRKWMRPAEQTPAYQAGTGH